MVRSWVPEAAYTFCLLEGIDVLVDLYLAYRISTKRETCLTTTLMDEGQARNPNTTFNGYTMEFWKFALTWKLICPVQHKLSQK